MTALDVVWQIFQVVKVILLYGWPFMLLIWLFIMRTVWKNWPVDVVLIEKREDNLLVRDDWAGKYTDSYTGLVGYRLRKAKDTIPIINYDWVLVKKNVPLTLYHRLLNILRPSEGALFLFRYGSKQYKPIKININKQAKIVLREIKDKGGNPVYTKIYQQFDPRKVLGSLDFEVVDWDNMNFMVQEQRASFERRKKKGEFMKQVLVPIGALVIAGLVCIMMIKFSYDWAVSMRGQTAPAPSAPTPVEDPNPNIPFIKDIIPGA